MQQQGKRLHAMSAHVDKHCMLMHLNPAATSALEHSQHLSFESLSSNSCLHRGSLILDYKYTLSMFEYRDEAVASQADIAQAMYSYAV